LVAAFRGTRQVGFAVIATTLVLIAVFVPISFLEGDLGKLFTEFAITLAVAVAFSSLVALSLSPMVASKVLRPHSDRGNWFTRTIDTVFRRFENGYRRTLEVALKVPIIALVIVIAVISLSVWLYKTIPSEFTPREDRGAFFVITTAPEGTSYASIRD